MARIITQTICVAFSRIVQAEINDPKPISPVTEFDRNAIKSVVDELSVADKSRVIEVYVEDRSVG